MGRGGSKTNNNIQLTSQQKNAIVQDVSNHTKSENDRAEKNLINRMKREKAVIDRFDDYVRLGRINSKDDEWWKEHERSYYGVKAQLRYFKKERKRQRR